MIKKIAKINNVYSYSFFDWDKINPSHGNNPNDPIDVFRKNNILFGENGNGKSRLVDIFKSLDGQPTKLEKSWGCDSADGQEIKIILDNGTETSFDRSSWSDENLKNKFLIFDKYFVEKFVHSVGTDTTDTPQRRQQRGRNIVYLGNFAEYNNEIDRINSLKNAISEKNSNFLQTEEAKITGLLNGHGITIDKLVSAKGEIQKLSGDHLDKKTEQLKKNQDELQKIEKGIREKNKIAALSLLAKINRSFSLDVEKVTLDPSILFSFTVAQGVQQTLDKIAHKKDFIREGVALITEGTTDCPFCGQKIKNGDYIQIVKDYQGIFNKTFAKEEGSVKLLLSKYKAILEDLRDLQAPTGNQGNLNAAKSFLTIDNELPQTTLSEEDKKIIKDEIDLVLEKEKNILEKIDGSKIDEIKKIIEKANNFIENYNQIVDQVNGKILQLGTDSTAGNLDTRKIELLKEIENLKNEIFYTKNKELFEKYFAVLDRYEANKKVVNSLERIYQTLKNKIVEEFNKFVWDYFDLIKGFIKEISPSMEIFDVIGQATFDRRNLRDPAQCGFRIEYNGKDCTGNLSEGEKQVIALAFFFAQLKKEKDKEKIIVLDDPITNFDAGKRKSTTEVIQKETKDFEQLFVLTCDPLFREYCLKQIDNRNFYYIFKTMGSSSIHYVPSNRETIYSAFETEFKDIEKVEGSNENVIVYGQKLRFCLETRIKEDYFGYSEDNLANMIKKVTGRKKEEFEKLFTNKEIILQIYSYCNTGGLAHYPKDGSTSWNELKDKINQYLNLEL